MTEVKDLPDLSKIETQDWFKAAYDAYKSDTYRTMLDDLGVGYHSSDNKSALTYRYLEATNGLQNDTAAKPVETKEATQETKQDTPQAPVSPERVNDESEVKVAPAAITPTKTADTKTTDTKTETISVKSKLGRDVLEPATGTRIIAGKTTKVVVSAKASRERILANLKQLNALNGNQLNFDE